jgi:phage recombination protein Bet
MRVARKFTTEEVGLVQRTMMKGASPDDVALFVATCERTGLDPFAGQIMPSSRRTMKNDSWITVWNYIVRIDGFRKIAVDTGEYEGQEGPWWCGPDGNWQEIWTGDKPCYAAKVLVHRKGFRTGLAGIAKYSAYVQSKKDGGPNAVWTSLGDHMTAKCAEALALRKAFPNEMAGLYTEDEQGAAEIVHAAIEEAHAPEVIEWSDEERESAKQKINDLMEVLLSADWSEEKALARLKKQKDAIGDPEIDFARWDNRYLALNERIKKELIPAPLPEGIEVFERNPA